MNISWYEIYHQYLTKYERVISSITRPLLDRFQVSFFGYHRISMSGDYTVLSNRLDWAEYYIENQLYLKDPFLRRPNCYSTGISLIEGHKKEPLNWAKIEVLEGVILVQKTVDAVEFSFFGGQNPQGGMVKLLLNNLPLLKTFTHYFKKKTEKLRWDQQTRGYNIPEQTPQKGENIIIPCIDSANRLQFLNAIGQEKLVKQFNSLSPQEKACLNLIGQDLTAKEIAQRLSLSPRTVESYLNMIRNKMDCYSKRELAAASKNFIHLGLF